METNNEKDKNGKTVEPVIDTEQDTARTEDNIEKNSSSKITSTFAKKHGRTNNSFGAGHEPGTTPGGGI